MYCTKCGTFLPANAQFCPNCGAPAPLAASQPAPASPQDATGGLPTPPTLVQTPASPSGNPNRRRLTIALCCAALASVVLAVLIIGQPSPRAANSVPVGLKVSAPNYAAGTDSPLPIRVTGKTSAGDDVNEVHFVKPGDATLYMPPGTYKLSLAASPLLASGDVYDTSTTVDLNVPAANYSTEQPQEQQTAAPEQAPAPAQQTVALDLTTKDPATITDDDISNATTYAKQAGDDASTDYSYSDDAVTAVIASVEDKRSSAPYAPYADVLAQYQAADAGGEVGPLVNAAPFQEARAMAQKDPAELATLPQTDIDRYGLSVGKLEYALANIDGSDTAALLVAYVWKSGGQQAGTSGNLVPYRLVDLYTADGSTPRRIMPPTDSSFIIPCADGTFVDCFAGTSSERYTMGEDGTYTSEALPVTGDVDDLGLREDFSWAPVADFKNDTRIGESNDAGTDATTSADAGTQGDAAQGNSTQADVWHYSDDYISVDLPASWQGVVQLAPSGHTSGAYHVDGCMAAMGPETSIIRFDGMKGDSNISVSYSDGCGRAIWSAIRNGTYDGLGTADAADVLARLTNGTVPPDDALSMDQGAFAAKVRDATRAYAGPVVSGSLAPS